MVLLLPRALGATLAMTDPVLRRGCGGAGRLLASVLLEQLFSMLLAPAMMLFHTSLVIRTLAGSPAAWHAQERGDRGVGFREALARHKWHVPLGLLWSAVILLVARHYIWWLMPVVVGLVLSVPLTMLTSSTRAGRWTPRRPAADPGGNPSARRARRIAAARGLGSFPWRSCDDQPVNSREPEHPDAGALANGGGAPRLCAAARCADQTAETGQHRALSVSPKSAVRARREGVTVSTHRVASNLSLKST